MLIKYVCVAAIMCNSEHNLIYNVQFRTQSYLHCIAYIYKPIVTMKLSFYM